MSEIVQRRRVQLHIDRFDQSPNGGQPTLEVGITANVDLTFLGGKWIATSSMHPATGSAETSQGALLDWLAARLGLKS